MCFKSTANIHLFFLSKKGNQKNLHFYLFFLV